MSYAVKINLINNENKEDTEEKEYFLHGKNREYRKKLYN